MAVLEPEMVIGVLLVVAAAILVVIGVVGGCAVVVVVVVVIGKEGVIRVEVSTGKGVVSTVDVRIVDPMNGIDAV